MTTEPNQPSWLNEQFDSYDHQQSRSTPPETKQRGPHQPPSVERSYKGGTQSDPKGMEIKMPEVVKHPDHPEDMSARIAKRLKPSNEMTTANTHVQHGNSPVRAHDTVHLSGSIKRHGEKR
jgi:hypothetical protein